MDKPEQLTVNEIADRVWPAGTKFVRVPDLPNPPLPWWPSTDITSTSVARMLMIDLWWFIENVGDDHPERTERFFLLRERYRSWAA